MVTTTKRLERAIALTPGERLVVLETFFAIHDKVAPGLGRAIVDFLNWQIQSGRIAEGGRQSPWWRAMNGMLVLDIADAMAASPGSCAARRWRRLAARSEDAQAALWEAHQRSLHGAISTCRGLFRLESPAEQAFARIVVDVVDRTALANRPTDSPELSSLTERFYPGSYPIAESAVAPLERMRARTAEALRARDGSVFDNVGMSSRRWG